MFKTIYPKVFHSQSDAQVRFDKSLSAVLCLNDVACHLAHIHMLWRSCEHCEFKSSLCRFQVPFQQIIHIISSTFCISLNSKSGKKSKKVLAGTKEELLSLQTQNQADVSSVKRRGTVGVRPLKGG